MMRYKNMTDHICRMLPNEVEEISRGTTPATGNTTENYENHNKKEEEKPSKSTVGDNHNNSDSDLHMDDAQ
ncbi:hypothetical protein GLOIN_2v1869486 [Rhizophagus irregularis DAOM 181602=DAOM 197198]|uniref:Uncharacterized protein n=1 Tax=Rhizophagus irregularis (strain DAOM 181602 / DAOM 197198 / MUCL 43194) TaxID=747089 RepID=A0A2P4QQ97_RHIID|nr:hypothetical protein GLOIN_2v1869486 [Rhizophagus irregularis DAOM 181602=DAOM 197198]POG79821.1 hypothetical protein GLOIN_2v1869486 [Rhizophagus irregularis DAOM 181602=DAOM 197198]|eukprot:XP_025186687.1 hypothetical protein GLOIN_2v1869486 [Rhizophagus irregularis DAOM 181602=DAOM 197198]